MSKKIKTTIVIGTENAIKFHDKYIVSTRFPEKERKQLLKLPNHFDSIEVYPKGKIIFINDTVTLFKPDGSATELISFTHYKHKEGIRIEEIIKSRILIKKSKDYEKCLLKFNR